MRKTYNSLRAVWALILLPTCISCGGERAGGLANTERKGGPRVVYDIDATPLPEIPLPNDAAMRLDPTSPTGRRLNVGISATTELEREVRQKFNRLDGFGTFAPLTVRFSAPIDVADLHRRHNANDDFRDDAVFLLNVDKRCQRYGEEVALDVGRGRFPIVLYSHSRRISDPLAPQGYRIDEGGNTLFDNDPRGDYNNLVFEERNEDQNGNGRLDAGEDLDHDGTLDQANFIDPSACDAYAVDTVAYDRCVADNLMTYYERETNTLITRPVWPLEERCEYAMVLTKRLVDAQGRPVESPFPAINHTDQTNTLAPIADLLPRYGLGVADVAFAWTFTTGSQTKDLEALRAGLYGHGKFEKLGQEFPPESLHVWTMGELAATSPTPDRKLFPGACGAEVVNRFWSYGIEEWEPNRCSIEAVVSAVGGFVGGTFDAPNLLVDKDGVATEKYPNDDDETWDIDEMAGKATYGKTSPTFWCVLPREEDTSCSAGNPEGKPFCKPFPVALYAHGYGGSRAEIFGFLGQHATMGIAVCSLDAYGHGLNRIGQDLLAAVSFGAIVDASEQLGTPGLLQLATLGRDRDLDNDGKADSGGDMWSADIFHTRDMVRQSVLETMQFVRILRSMDGTQK
ncbi:MAG TPA: hypothetical protein PK156_49185, partial [Polyangium sp.]|nr:hypothetical protein [Polyangium sp.]